METSTYVGATLVGGTVDLPSYTFLDRPLNITTEQINLAGTQGSTIKIIGTVTQQATGIFIGGANRNYPGVL